QIPSGILHQGVRCAIGNGVVLDPYQPFEELDGLVKKGIDVEGRLYVSDRPHRVLPYHKLLAADTHATKARATPRRASGPAQADDTASSTTSGGAAIGVGIAPTSITAVVGVVKAYTTRVGAGPLPTEMDEALGERTRQLGKEFGATTGRPRRCGWFDAVVVR